MEQRCIQLEGGLKKSQFELQQKCKQVNYLFIILSKLLHQKGQNASKATSRSVLHSVGVITVCAHCIAVSGGGSGRTGSDAAEGFEGEDDATAAGGTDVQEAETGTRQQSREVRRTRSTHDRTKTEVRRISGREFEAHSNSQIDQVLLRFLKPRNIADFQSFLRPILPFQQLT